MAQSVDDGEGVDLGQMRSLSFRGLQQQATSERMVMASRRDESRVHPPSRNFAMRIFHHATIFRRVILLIYQIEVLTSVKTSVSDSGSKWRRRRRRNFGSLSESFDSRGA